MNDDFSKIDKLQDDIADLVSSYAVLMESELGKILLGTIDYVINKVFNCVTNTYVESLSEICQKEYWIGDKTKQDIEEQFEGHPLLDEIIKNL